MPRISKAATYGSDSAERRVAKVINGSWPVLEGFTGTDIAHEMIRVGNAEGFIRNMPWDTWAQDMGGVVDPMSRQITNSIRDQLKSFPRSVNGTVNFNVVDALSVKYAQTQSSQLIKNLSDSQRATVRQVMGDALQGNLTVDQAARRIRSTIGLHPAWAQAVVNYEERQLKALSKTMSAAKAAETAAKRAGRYKESLTRKRALMVARTEIHISSGLGRLAANKTAIDHGYAGTDSRREWSAGPNACKICTGLSGETVKWDQPYSNGEMIAHAHPGCRCADVFMPSEYGDADLDPEVMNWLDDPDGVGASRFDAGGLTASSFVMGDAVVSTTTATLAPSQVQTGAVSSKVDTEELARMADEIEAASKVAREALADPDELAFMRRFQATGVEPYLDELEYAELRKAYEQASTATGRKVLDEGYFHSDDSFTINEALRNGEKITDDVKEMVKASKEWEAPHDMVSYRGMWNMDNLGDNSLVGSTWDDAGFQSTTIDRRIAEQWAMSRGENVVVMKVYTKKGTPMAMGHDQMEMLLPPGTPLRVVGDTMEEVAGRKIRVLRCVVE